MYLFSGNQPATPACFPTHAKKHLPSATELLSPGGAAKEDTDTITRSNLQAYATKISERQGYCPRVG